MYAVSTSLGTHDTGDVRNTCGQRVKIMVIVKVTRTMPQCHYNNIFINTTVKMVSNHGATTTLAAAAAKQYKLRSLVMMVMV